MSFKEALKLYAENRKAEFLTHVRQEIIDLVNSGEAVTWDSWQVMRLNSYERQLVIPCLDDNAFAKALDQFLIVGQMEELSQYSRPPVTYNEAIEKVLIFQLLRRFKGIIGL